MDRLKRKEDINNSWKEDRAGYPQRPWLKEPSIIALKWYRHGQHVDNMREGLRKRISMKIYWFVFHLIEIFIGVSLPKTA